MLRKTMIVDSRHDGLAVTRKSAYPFYRLHESGDSFREELGPGSSAGTRVTCPGRPRT